MGTLSEWIWIRSLMLILTRSIRVTRSGVTLRWWVTGVERERDNDHQSLNHPTPNRVQVPDKTAHWRTEGEKQNVIIVVSYEGDTDPMNRHKLLRRVACTTLISWLGSVLERDHERVPRHL